MTVQSDLNPEVNKEKLATEFSLSLANGLEAGKISVEQAAVNIVNFLKSIENDQ